MEAACRIEPAQGLVAQVFGGSELSDLDGSFVRKAGVLEDTGREGEVASINFDSVLLSDEFQGGRAQVGKTVVIQGCVGSVAHCASNVEADVSELEGLRALGVPVWQCLDSRSDQKKATMMRSMT